MRREKAPALRSYQPPKRTTSDFPPLIPTEEDKRARVMELLLSRTKGELDKNLKAELKTLIGVVPTPAQAAAWRQAIKRGEMREASES